eukprot:COSAG02_NODE_4256_length_5579_cov_2.549453_2_plen_95_part_00
MAAAWRQCVVAVRSVWRHQGACGGSKLSVLALCGDAVCFKRGSDSAAISVSGATVAAVSSGDRRGRPKRAATKWPRGSWPAVDLGSAVGWGEPQ